MSSRITRRDFLNGVAIAVAGSLSPLELQAAAAYPPARLGLRGAHPGSFEVAHGLRDGASWEERDIGEEYDLVVVGAGISGLAAAYFYQRDGGGSTLLLDNHDDFGGHAKRNEFSVDGRQLIGFGGTMLVEAPGDYPQVAADLIAELGVDTERLHQAFDQQLYQDLSRGTFLDRRAFGRDHLAVGPLGEVLKDLPVPDAAREELKRLAANDRHYLNDMSRAEQIAYLDQTTYEAYLRDRAGIGAEARRVISALPRGVWAIGIDALPARTAWSSGYPGFGDLELDAEPYSAYDDRLFHFPDGNASIARLLVRRMIPRVAPGSSMDDIVTARFDYAQLDQPNAPVRLRLNSTVVRVRHEKETTGPVRVTYVRDGRAHTVKARRVVLACYHAMVPALCPELPAPQQGHLRSCLRAPLVYTNVAIRNWRAFAKLGLRRADCPASYFHNVMLDFPVSLGDYRFAASPDEPILLHLNRVPGQPGLSAAAQFAAGKRELLETPFSTFEHHVRDQLGRMLGSAGFDPDRDIAAITVNRWPHGYAYGYDRKSGQVAFEPSRWPEARHSWRGASTRFGQISFAGTDAASNAMTEAAIEEAYRAVQDLKAGP
ncbi:MAG: NAD(P)-binding protein [Pseudomonadota bacterium]